MLKSKYAGKPKYLKQDVSVSPKYQNGKKDSKVGNSGEQKSYELKSIARKWGFYDSGNQADMQGLLNAVKNGNHRPSKSLKPLENSKPYIEIKSPSNLEKKDVANISYMCL